MTERTDLLSITVTKYEDSSVPLKIRKLGPYRYAIDILRTVSIILELWFLERRT